ncbi:TetR family transcriptional regulator [Brevibacterium sp. S111]|jgi:AcrR family transcriptional regulator|nr:TetR family transcriptional regulator [Brevibacterium sp. S111]
MQADSVTERTGGRSARVRAAALRAVAELLDEQSAEEITTAEVARRSGVNRSTLHRRWGGVSGLLADLAFEQLEESSPLPPVSGDLRQALLEWARRVIEALESYPPGHSPFIAGLMRAAQRGGVIPAEVVRPRLDSLADLLTQAAGRGWQMRLSERDLVEIVLLPIYAAKLLSSEPLTDDLAVRLVDRFLLLNGSGETSADS